MDRKRNKKSHPFQDSIFHFFYYPSIQPGFSGTFFSPDLSSFDFFFLLVYGLKLLALLDSAFQRFQPFLPVPCPVPLFFFSFVISITPLLTCIIARWAPPWHTPPSNGRKKYWTSSENFPDSLSSDKFNPYYFEP